MAKASETRAKGKYNNKSYDRFLVSVPIGYKQVIDYVAKSKGETVNSFITGLIYDAIGAETVDDFSLKNPGFKPLQTVADPSAITKDLREFILAMNELGIPASTIRTILKDEYDVSVPTPTITTVCRDCVAQTEIQSSYPVVLINYEEHNLSKWIGDKKVYHVFGVQKNTIRDFLGLHVFDCDATGCIDTIGQSLYESGIKNIQTVFVPRKYHDPSIESLKKLYKGVIVCKI